MNKRLIIWILTLAWVGIAGLSGCKKCDDPTNPECENYCDDPADPACFNYDPCLGKAPVSAAFEIREAFFLGYPEGWPTYDTDTVVTGLVEFYALEEGAQYEWYLGSEVIRTRSFARSDFPPGNTIVRLKVTKQADTLCFPDDDGEDIQTRAFFQESGCSSLLNGRYRGVLSESPLDTFEAFVDLCNLIFPPNPAYGTSAIIGGFEQACDTLSVGFDQLTVGSHRQLLIGELGINTGGPCRYMQGFMALNPDNLDSLKFDFYWNKICRTCNTDIVKHFRGIRIR